MTASGHTFKANQTFPSDYSDSKNEARSAHTLESRFDKNRLEAAYHIYARYLESYSDDVSLEVKQAKEILDEQTKYYQAELREIKEREKLYADTNGEQFVKLIKKLLKQKILPKDIAEKYEKEMTDMDAMLDAMIGVQKNNKVYHSSTGVLGDRHKVNYQFCIILKYFIKPVEKLKEIFEPLFKNNIMRTNGLFVFIPLSRLFEVMQFLHHELGETISLLTPPTPSSHDFKNETAEQVIEMRSRERMVINFADPLPAAPAESTANNSSGSSAMDTTDNLNSTAGFSDPGLSHHSSHAAASSESDPTARASTLFFYEDFSNKTITPYNVNSSCINDGKNATNSSESSAMDTTDFESLNDPNVTAGANQSQRPLSAKFRALNLNDPLKSSSEAKKDNKRKRDPDQKNETDANTQEPDSNRRKINNP